MRKYLGVLAAAGLVSLPGLASAAGPTLSDVLGNSNIAVSGDVETSYTHGFNKGQALGPFREFDTTGDSFTFNQALLNVSYLPSDGFGAAATLVAGDDAKVISGTYGDNSGNFALNQAYVQYAHGPFTIMAGRYNTLSGAEVIQADGNSNFSRSILYFEGEPFVHTGVRASYAIAGATAYLGLANTVYKGVATDVNKNKAIESGVALPAMGPVTLAVFNYYTNDTAVSNGVGPATKSKSNLMDFVATLTATDKLSFVLNGDWNHVFGVSNFYGVAAYANYAISSQWKTSLRAEFARDSGNPVAEVTGTVGYSPFAHVTLLGEVRYNHSHGQIYPDSATYVTNPDGSITYDHYKKNELDLALSAIYSF